MSAGKKSVRRTIRQIRHAGRSRADRLFGAPKRSILQIAGGWLMRMLSLFHMPFRFWPR